MADANRIIYATDLSPASLAGFPHAEHLALKLGAELTICPVLPTPASTLLAEGGFVPQAVWDVAAAPCPVVTVRAAEDAP